MTVQVTESGAGTERALLPPPRLCRTHVRGSESSAASWEVQVPAWDTKASAWGGLRLTGLGCELWWLTVVGLAGGH